MKTYRYGSTHPFWTKAVMKKTIGVHKKQNRSNTDQRLILFRFIWKVFPITVLPIEEIRISPMTFKFPHFCGCWRRHRSGPGMSAMSSMSMGGGGLGHLAVELVEFGSWSPDFFRLGCTFFQHLDNWKVQKEPNQNNKATPKNQVMELLNDSEFLSSNLRFGISIHLPDWIEVGEKMHIICDVISQVSAAKHFPSAPAWVSRLDFCRGFSYDVNWGASLSRTLSRGARNSLYIIVFRFFRFLR